MEGVEEISPWEEEIRKNKIPTKMSGFFFIRQQQKIYHCEFIFSRKEEKMLVTRVTKLLVNNSLLVNEHNSLRFFKNCIHNHK